MCTHAQSQFWAVKTDLWQLRYSFDYILESSFSMDEIRNVHLEIGNIKQTELQRLKNR